MSNPVEVGIGGRGQLSDHYEEVLELVAQDTNIDVIFIRINLEIVSRAVEINDEKIKEYANIWACAAKNLPKPIVVVFDRGEYLEPMMLAYKMREACSNAGVASFPSVESAAKAISKVAQYYGIK